MRPQLLTISTEPGYSFSVRREVAPDVSDRWHFHPEVELIHFKKGQGTQFVGDGMQRFREGDVLLIGSNLPHYWRFDGQAADVRVVHFSENFCGDAFLRLPETVHLKTTLDKSKRGLLIDGEARKKVGGLLEKMLTENGMHRLLLLIEILDIISGPCQTQPLSSISFQHYPQENVNHRLDDVHAYSIQHFRDPILLEEIAAVANISPNSFCRWFKSTTRKTYSRFLLEIRVGHACKLLMENELNIKQLCYECGFNNFTSFYKYFKLITGKSPLGYQREFSNFSLKKLYV